MVDNQWVFYIISLKGKKVFMVTRERWQGVLLFMQKKRLQTTTLVILHTHVCCFLPYFQLSSQAQSKGLGRRPKSGEPSSLFLRSGWKSLWSLWHVRLRVIKSTQFDIQIWSVISFFRQVRWCKLMSSDRFQCQVRAWAACVMC